jgi:hypothetical protein
MFNIRSFVHFFVALVASFFLPSRLHSLHIGCAKLMARSTSINVDGFQLILELRWYGARLGLRLPFYQATPASAQILPEALGETLPIRLEPMYECVLKKEGHASVTLFAHSQLGYARALYNIQKDNDSEFRIHGLSMPAIYFLFLHPLLFV